MRKGKKKKKYLGPKKGLAVRLHMGSGALQPLMASRPSMLLWECLAGNCVEPLGK